MDYQCRSQRTSHRRLEADTLDQVTSMRVFVRIAASGSFAAAARALGLSQTMVTKHVDALEARMGVRLLHRSTRRLTFTEAGRAYLDACGRILTEIDDAEREASAGQAEPSGLLRMNVPVSFGILQVAPSLAAFGARHPRVSVELGITDKVVDLIEEGWDLAVRIGLLHDTSLVARRLSPCRTVLCAAPAYLQAHGVPRTVAELSGHNCLGYTLSDRLGWNRWCFGPDGEVVASVTGTLRSNNGDVLRAAALGGLGLIYQPSFLVADDLRSGRLSAISLDQPTMTVGHVYAVFRPDRHLPAKSRAMIDFLAARFGDDPPWDAAS